MDEVNGVPEQERLIPLPEEGSDAMPDDDEMVDLAALEASVAGVEAYLSSIDDPDTGPPAATLDDAADEEGADHEKFPAERSEPEAGLLDPTDPPPGEPPEPNAFEAIAGSGSEAVELDVPIPPRPGAADRLARLESAGAAMRVAVRAEIRGATDHILDSALARARAEIAAEVGRFEQDMRRELDVVREDLRRRAAADRSEAVAERLVAIESRLEDLSGVLDETREAVLGLRRRYLPNGGGQGGNLPGPG